MRRTQIPTPKSSPNFEYSSPLYALDLETLEITMHYAGSHQSWLPNDAEQLTQRVSREKESDRERESETRQDFTTYFYLGNITEQMSKTKQKQKIVDYDAIHRPL